MLELFTDSLLEVVQDAMGIPATFRGVRGGETRTKAITVTPGHQSVEITDGPEGFLRVPERQTQFKVEAAAIAREFGDPIEDDEFLIQLDDRLQTWQILRPSSLAKAVVPTDHLNRWWRCFAKLVDEDITVAGPVDAGLSAEPLTRS